MAEVNRVQSAINELERALKLLDAARRCSAPYHTALAMLESAGRRVVSEAATAEMDEPTRERIAGMTPGAKFRGNITGRIVIVTERRADHDHDYNPVIRFRNLQGRNGSLRAWDMANRYSPVED